MLNSKKIAFLKALSHHKKPIVTIGNKGLTEPVVKEIMAGLKAKVIQAMGAGEH